MKDHEASGMSRAAKKRAKKRQKQQKQKDELEVLNKKQKHENENYSETKEPTTTINEAPTTELDHESVDDTNQIESILSKLSPAQILLLQDIDKDIQDFEPEHVRHLLENEVTSTTRARCLFQSILGPDTSLEQFYNEYWERKPLLVQNANDKNRFQTFISLARIRQLLDKETLAYGRDLNVTRYDKDGGGRVTLDLVSNDDTFVAADAKDVWSNYNDGCTLRLLCPQLHWDAIHSLLSTLELEWNCMVGANAYLTPPRSSQGFAPHYDDIEAFVLQVEGHKQWKVYAPWNRAETLPRESSRDYTAHEMSSRTPVLDVTLGPGDLLYMPRGWIHQACTSSNNEHSLHLTMSAMQTWAWVDLLELLLPEALEAAAQSDTSTSLREGLPRNFLNYMGIIHTSDKDDETQKPAANNVASEHEDDSVQSEKNAQREQFREEAKKRIMRVCKEAMSMIDAGCDQIGKRFISDRLPPALTPNEVSLTNEGPTENGGGKVWPNTLVRLVRPGIARLALEDEKAVLYHCVDNSRVYQGNPLSPMEFEMDDAPALEALLTTVEPHWIRVADLMHNDIEDKMAIAQSLYDEGILAVLQTDAPDQKASE